VATIQYGQIKSWPGTLRTKSERIKAPFKSGHSETLRLLDRELRMIYAESAVVQLAMAHFNRNGQPYFDAVPEHPGVLVSFVKPIKGKIVTRVPLRFAADRFLTWETNLRAVAIGLTDLRRVERYGITTGSEQYLGFKALPPPGPSHDSILTVEDAARFVVGIVPDGPKRPAIESVADCWRTAYREAASKLHPDAGGNPGDWAKLQAAKSLLDAHHGI
jgi:hypothetical protein